MTEPFFHGADMRIFFQSGWTWLALALTCLAVAVARASARRLPSSRAPAASSSTPRRARQSHPRFLALWLRRRRPRHPRCAGRVTVAPADGDDGARIQAAIDAGRRACRLATTASAAPCSSHPANSKSPANCESQRPASSCAAPGQAQGGTTLVATGLDRRTLVRIVGANDRGFDAEAEFASSTTTCPSVRDS